MGKALCRALVEFLYNVVGVIVVLLVFLVILPIAGRDAWGMVNE